MAHEQLEALEVADLRAQSDRGQRVDPAQAAQPSSLSRPRRTREQAEDLALERTSRSRAAWLGSARRAAAPVTDRRSRSPTRSNPRPLVRRRGRSSRSSILVARSATPAANRRRLRPASSP